MVSGHDDQGTTDERTTTVDLAAANELFPEDLAVGHVDRDQQPLAVDAIDLVAADGRRGLRTAAPSEMTTHDASKLGGPQGLTALVGVEAKGLIDRAVQARDDELLALDHRRRPTVLARAQALDLPHLLEAAGPVLANAFHGTAQIKGRAAPARLVRLGRRAAGSGISRRRRLDLRPHRSLADLRHPQRIHRCAHCVDGTIRGP